MMNFSIGRRFRAPNDLFWAHERVLTHSVERSKWLEELASESNTGTMKYYSAGKIGVSDPMQLCVSFGWFFIDIFGLMYSFGLALFVVHGMVHLHMWELVRSPGNPYGKD